ncbi:MAG: YkgJ family cysteine cluster protein [Pirellulales bacterium]|nr:YkgJ family cysteine cluster protein [Pirellulales bacterium]
MSKQPWYAETGLRFTCTQCGDCCTGTPGFVWLNAAESAAMAQRLNLSLAEFHETYTKKVGARRSLIERENGDCILLDPVTRGCTVYEDRPRQCKTWPFWDSNIESPQAWAETCSACPGCNHGRLYTVSEIQTQAAVIKL